MEPFLHGLEVVCAADGEPAVADVAEDALCVEFADVAVLLEEGVALVEGVYGVDVLAAAVKGG